MPFPTDPSPLASAVPEPQALQQPVGSEEPTPMIRRVLVAMRFTDACTRALRYAHGLLPHGGTIHLVHVCPVPTQGINPLVASAVYFDHSMALTRQLLDAEQKFCTLPAALLNAPGVSVTTAVLTHADRAVAICEEAERQGADIICMAGPGRHRTTILLVSSTIDSVIAISHIPVLVVLPPKCESTQNLPGD